MNLINFGDILDTYIRLYSHGAGYFLAKLKLRKKDRVINTWQEGVLRTRKEQKVAATDWWQIPEVVERWNKKISGDPHVPFPKFVVNKYFPNNSELTLLSIGCGTGERELEYASTGKFSRIDAFDITPNAIEEAREKSKSRNLTMTNFFVADVDTFDFESKRYDVVLFEQSLHHFTDIDNLLMRVSKSMHDESYLILDEYTGPNRFQFSKERINKSNIILKQVPEKLRMRSNLNIIKKLIYAPGLLRMLITDPSEAVESSTILPAVHNQFKTIEEKGYGGNLLHFLLKDITHNFIPINETNKSSLEFLFDAEDKMMLEEGKSDFVLGIYKK